MGGLLHFLDFNHAGTSRKSLRHKRHTDGVDAPRNSMEFPIEASPSYHAVYENIPFSCEVKKPFMMNSYSNGTPMKKLIDEEMTDRIKSTSGSPSAPSVIARLMGMDALPSEAEFSGTSKGNANNVSMNQRPKKLSTDIHSGQHKINHSEPLKQRREEWHPHDDNDPAKSNQCSRTTKPKTREHPQEEILQKFKKEFEAWQANKVWEHPKVVGVETSLNPRREKLKFTQVHHKMEKKANHTDASRNYNPLATSNSRIREAGLQNEGYVSKQSQFHRTEELPMVTRGKTVECGNVPIMKYAEKNDRCSSPTRIVLLKPSSENFDDIEEMWPGSAASMQREVSMEDFLEEVKERLRMEIQGKSKSAMVAGSASNTFSKERYNNPRQLAQNIARQIRESVSSNMGTTLRSDFSTRPYKSESQFNGTDFPELINRDSRQLLSERLMNSLRNVEDTNESIVMSHRARTSPMVQEQMRLRPHTDLMRSGKKTSYWEENKNLIEVKTKSFRIAGENDVVNSEASPRKLVRSLSAPVSGAAFSKIVFEDKHVLVGTHIQRKRDVTENPKIHGRKSKKDSFDFKGRVSNLRHNLNLRSKLFGRRVHLMEEASVEESDDVKIIQTVPQVVTNFGTPQENATEVPPSPASVSSDSHDDQCKPGYPSPVSPLEVPFVEGQEHPLHQNPEEETSCVIPEPSSSILCEKEGTQQLVTEVDLYDDDEIIELDDPEEAYVRDILVTAGLYERELKGNALLRWEALSQPLSRWVFEEVEEVYSHKYKKADDDSSSLLYSDEASIDRQMLFDLLNEALPYVLKPFSTGLHLEKYPAISYGKRLLENVWNQIQILTRLPYDDHDCSLERMAAHDVRKAPWPVMVREETGGVGVKVEMLILEQLLEDIVLELYYD